MNVGDIMYLLSYILIVFIWILIKNVITKRKKNNKK